MNGQQITDAFEDWRKFHVKNAWKPVIDNADTETHSWFGGEPANRSDSDWPRCAQCKRPMQFFLQLDLSTLPEEFKYPIRKGLMQLFYCSSDDGTCETWAHFTGTHAISIIEFNTEITQRNNDITPLTQNKIASWKRIDDLPHVEEHEMLGVHYEYDFKKNRVTIECKEHDLHFKNIDVDSNPADAIAEAASGDKLGGWPFWVQSAEYPNCPTCDQQMSLLFQIDSEDNLDYMFGDVGCAHLTYCTNHPETIAFGWACC